VKRWQLASAFILFESLHGPHSFTTTSGSLNNNSY
jgi:hypothetical protein